MPTQRITLPPAVSLADLSTALTHAQAHVQQLQQTPAGPNAKAEASIDLAPILHILIPLIPLLKPIVKQLVLDNLDPALDALFKALTDAAAKA